MIGNNPITGACFGQVILLLMYRYAQTFYACLQMNQSVRVSCWLFSKPYRQIHAVCFFHHVADFHKIYAPVDNILKNNHQAHVGTPCTNQNMPENNIAYLILSFLLFL